jgi:CubicO group peptidase (beta-lactamase class C family)
VIACAALIFLLPGYPAQGREPLPQGWESGVADYVEAEMARLDIPGVGVAVVHDGDLVFADGFGVAAPDGRDVSSQTVFPIFSVSKAITAMAVMQLVEAGRFGLDSSLADLIPELVAGESEVSAITVSDLLAHTSGWTERDGTILYADLGPDPYQGLAERIVSTPLGNEIGEFEYSNVNYDLLGYLVQRMSGERLDAYLRRHVFEPLQMDNTFTSDEEAQDAGLASGHYPYFGFVGRRDAPLYPGRLASAGVLASAEDLGRLLLAHLNAGAVDGARVLSPEVTRQLHDPLVHPTDPCCGYAMGLWVYPMFEADRLVDGQDVSRYEVPVVLEHGGSGPSHAAGIIVLPEQDLGVAVLMNVNDETQPSLYHQMHRGIANVLLGLTPPRAVAFENFVRRNAKVITALLIVGFATRAAISFVRVRRLTCENVSISRNVMTPLAVDVVILGLAWWLLITQGNAPVATIRWATPDIFWGFVAATSIGVGWAIARSVLTLGALRTTDSRHFSSDG